VFLWRVGPLRRPEIATDRSYERRALTGLRLLGPVPRIKTRDGAKAEILARTEDGAWIKVRYVDVKTTSHRQERRLG
jgi:hypothetical protein